MGRPKTIACAVALVCASALAAETPVERDWDQGTRTLDAVTSIDEKTRALAEGRRDPKQVLTIGARFDPTLGTPDVDASLGFNSRARARPAGERAPLLVQLVREVEASDATWLAERGFEVLRHIPNRTLLVRGDAANAAALRADDRVRWVGPYRSDFKVRREILTASYDGRFFLEAMLLPGGSTVPVLAELSEHVTNVREVTRAMSPGSGSIVVEIDGRDLRSTAVALADHPDVERVELWSMPVPHNDHSIWAVQSYDTVNRTNYAQSATIWNHGILGTGQIVAVADTRFDTDVCYLRYSTGGFALAQQTTPPDPGVIDPAAKVLAHAILPGATHEGGSDHGTHVAGSVAGDNWLQPSTPTAHGHDAADGMAPQARLYLQGLSGPSGSLVGALVPPYLLSQQAHDAGARLQTHSWGASFAGEAAPYGGAAMEKDRFTWDHEEFLHVFSIGNQDLGPEDWLATPANAKNVLGVGATTHGSADATAPASFNAFGPALDGRVKPDVLVPGEFIASAESNAITGDGNCSWKQLSGTSMAAPTAAGAAALVRQYFTDGFHPTGTSTAGHAFVPSAALVKATLIHSAVDLGTANVPQGSQEGWGRVWLDRVLAFPGDPERLRVWEKRNAHGLATSAMDSYAIQVVAGQPLVVTLVWSDPPAVPASAIDLVNDLDLEVVGPGGTYRGNALVSGQSVAGGAKDAINNVEKVILASPPPGAYSVRVRAAAVPGNGFTAGSDRQGYALVATHATCAGAPSSAPSALSVTNQGASGIAVSWLPGAANHEILRARGSCAAPTTGWSLVGTTSGTSYLDTSVDGGHRYAYRVRGTSGCGTGPSACADAVSTADCDLSPIFTGAVTATDVTNVAACGIDLAWDPATSGCPAAPALVYNVYRSTNPHFVPGPANRVATGVSGTTWRDSSALGLVTQHYVVRAEDGTSGHGGPAHGGNQDGNLQRVHATARAAATVLGTFTDAGGDGGARLTLEDPWRITSEDNHTPGGSSSYKTGADGMPHGAGVCAAATTPPLELGPGTPELVYWANYNLERGYDGVVVEVSTDGGETWSDLPPDEVAGGVIERYPGWVDVGACRLPAGHGAINNPNTFGLGGWFEFVHELAEYAGRTVQIRWRLTSDSYVEYEGMYLDDIRITRAHMPRECATPSVAFDRSRYGCADTLAVTASDAGRAGAGSVTVRLASSAETETLTLVETGAATGIFSATVGTSTSSAVTGDGLLRVSPNEMLSAILGPGVEDDATVDCDAVDITNVRAVDVRHDRATIVWQTSDWADSVLRWGPTPPPPNAIPGPAALDHARVLTGLSPCTTYRFSIEATDDAGNTVVDDAGGSYYVFTTALDADPEWCAAHATPVIVADVTDSCVAGGPGNANGRWDPGETVQFRIDVRNDGPVALAGVTATVTPLTPGATMVDASASYGTIAAGQVVGSQAPHFTMRIPTGLDCWELVRLLVDVHSGSSTSSGILEHRLGGTTIPCAFNRCNQPAPVPDGVTGTGIGVVRNNPPGTSLTVSWDTSACSSAGYEILYGSLGTVSGPAPSGGVCALGTSGSHVWTGVPAGNLWFLVVGHGSNGTEGSWGTDSDGSHRGGITPSDLCGNTARDNDDDCD